MKSAFTLAAFAFLGVIAAGITGHTPSWLRQVPSEWLPSLERGAPPLGERVTGPIPGVDCRYWVPTSLPAELSGRVELSRVGSTVFDRIRLFLHEQSSKLPFGYDAARFDFVQITHQSPDTFQNIGIQRTYQGYPVDGPFAYASMSGPDTLTSLTFPPVVEKITQYPALASPTVDDQAAKQLADKVVRGHLPEEKVTTHSGRLIVAVRSGIPRLVWDVRVGIPDGLSVPYIRVWINPYDGALDSIRVAYR